MTTSNKTLGENIIARYLHYSPLWNLNSIEVAVRVIFHFGQNFYFIPASASCGSYAFTRHLSVIYIRRTPVKRFAELIPVSVLCELSAALKKFSFQETEALLKLLKYLLIWYKFNFQWSAKLALLLITSATYSRFLNNRCLKVQIRCHISGSSRL